LLKNIKTPLI